MSWPVVILDGPLRNQTLSTVLFDKHGNPTQQHVIICDSWIEGFNTVKQNNHTSALFVKSGTMFSDWAQWKTLLDTYPHTGLVAHLIWPPGQRLKLDDQCWFMNLSDFDGDDFNTNVVRHPEPIRSTQNLHDDYTPLWVKPGHSDIEYQANEFGQGLIAKQLGKNRAIVNWNNAARDIKFFSYNNAVDLDRFRDYKELAENQLWIFNNEPIVVVNQKKLVSPGSGLSWMLNINSVDTVEMSIVDISRVQINFCRELWTQWNGVDYGSFVWNFITKNNLIRYQLDDPHPTPMQKLTLKKRSTFIEYVDNKFKVQAGENFSEYWQHSQKTKTVKFFNDNLIDWVLKNGVGEYDNIWCSNILNYKWTLLHTTVEQYDIFKSKIQ